MSSIEVIRIRFAGMPGVWLCALLALMPACSEKEMPRPAAWQEVLLSERREKDIAFRNGSESPLPGKDRAGFRGLDYYPVDPSLRCQVRLNRYPSPRAVRIGTNTGEVRSGLRYGYFEFEVDGKACRLQAYRMDEDQGGRGPSPIRPLQGCHYRHRNICGRSLCGASGEHHRQLRAGLQSRLQSILRLRQGLQLPGAARREHARDTHPRGREEVSRSLMRSGHFAAADRHEHHRECSAMILKRGIPFLWLLFFAASCQPPGPGGAAPEGALYPEEILSAAERRQEIFEKERRVLEWLRHEGLSAVLLSAPANFAWITGGGSRRLDPTAPFSAPLLIRDDGRKFIFDRRRAG